MRSRRTPVILFVLAALLFGAGGPGAFAGVPAAGHGMQAAAQPASPGVVHADHHASPAGHTVHAAHPADMHAGEPGLVSAAHDCGLQCDGTCQHCVQCHGALTAPLAVAADLRDSLRVRVLIPAEQIAGAAAYRPPTRLQA